MKKCILLLVLLAFQLSGQDSIRFKSNEIKAVKVSEIGIDDVKYHRFDNLEGPQYVADKSDIHYIRYQNGHIDTFKVDAKVAVSSATSNMSSAPLISFKGKKLVYGGRGLNDSKLYRIINNYQYPRTKSIMLNEFKLYKKYKRNEIISRSVGLGVGIGSAYVGMLGGLINSDPAIFLTGVIISATVGITGCTLAKINKNKRYAQKIKIAKMYNEMK